MVDHFSDSHTIYPHLSFYLSRSIQHTSHASSKTKFDRNSIFSAKQLVYGEFIWVLCLLLYCRCSEILYVVLRVWTLLFLEYRENGVAYSVFKSSVYVCVFPIPCLCASLLLHTSISLHVSDVQYLSMYAMHLFCVLTYGMSLNLL